MCDRCWYNFTHSLFIWCGLAWSLNMPFYIIHAKTTFILFYGLLSIPLLTQSGSREYNTALCVCLRVWEAGIVLSCRCSYVSHTSSLHMPCMALSPDMVGTEERSSTSHIQKFGCMQTWEWYKCVYMQPQAKACYSYRWMCFNSLCLCVKCMNTGVEIFLLITIIGRLRDCPPLRSLWTYLSSQKNSNTVILEDIGQYVYNVSMVIFDC